MRQSALFVAGLVGAGALPAQTIPPLPDSGGWGVHVLALARAPDSSIWVGTYGRGIFVLRSGAARWENLRASGDTARRSISWGFVHAFGFGSRGETWYGTLGNGWGLSTDGGGTWRNWEFRDLGPEWQYVAPDGIVVRGDTVYIATADGIKLTGDNGATWHAIADGAGASANQWGRLGNEYVLRLSRLPGSGLVATHLAGSEASRDGGRSWTAYADAPPRATRPPGDSAAPPVLCADPRVGVRTATLRLDTDRELVGTPFGLVVTRAGEQPSCLGAVPGTAPAAAAPPGEPRHTWFGRPIGAADNPFIDQTYRFGSTMVGNFQPHQGVEFNNPDGTPVRAVGGGVVAFAGPAEAGALTVAIRHDRTLDAATAGGAQRFVFSVYYHNSRLLVAAGQRVEAGDVIALVGNTGRATNDHLHFEIHVPAADSVALVVDPAVRYPPYNANPELWIEPLPGTGLVAGTVWDLAGRAVHQARIYGLVKRDPQETPFSFIETYGPRNHADPVYREHFAIGDVPPGTYVLGVTIDGQAVYRRVSVEPGKLSWVEFRPEARH